VRQARFVDRAPVEAAVLVPLVARAAGLSVLLTERAMGLPTHAGQVAFPGGKVEAGDGDVVHAACARRARRSAWRPASSTCWASCRCMPRARSFWSRRWWRW
jgi:hypothetical protein